MALSTSTASDAATGSGEGKGLKVGAIGLLSTTVIAIGSVAPAYSLAAALGFIVIDVGHQAVAAVMLAFVPMILIAQGYNRLNREMPDCGTTFTWGAKAFGPKTGWMGGWAIVVADVIVMANLAQIAGSYMFQLFGAYGLASSTGWTLLSGVGWIVVMCAICYIGIEVSARLQYALLAVEILMLLILSITALVKVYGGTAPAADPADIKAKVAGAGPHHIAASWFNPFHSSLSAITIAMLTAIFIYWGWDTAVSINEETKDKDKTPGQAAILATLVLLVTYTLVSVSTTAFAGLGTHGIGFGNPDNSSDVLSNLGAAIFGQHGFGHIMAKLLIFMVLTSAMASTLTTILPTARTTLSMAVYRAIPARFAKIHPRYLTPTWSTVGMGVISIVFFVGTTYINSGKVLLDLIGAIGLPIAFYYAMTGYECVWWYRKRLTSDSRMLLTAGVFPLVGALILTFFFGYGCYYYWQAGNSNTFWTLPFSPHWAIGGIFFSGVLSIAFGFVLIAVYRRFNPAYFQGITLNADTPILVPEGDTVSVAMATEMAEHAIELELAEEEAKP
jgi:amino acid transporter